MNKFLLHKKMYGLLAMILFCMCSFSFAQPVKRGTLKVTFVQTANGKDIVLRDSVYTNAFGETYSVNKLKYYVSNFSVPGSAQVTENDPYHLVNALEESINSFDIQLAAGTYQNIEFLLGVDSARNCSGAQSGALDPMNDMFWTWNSGYVMFKMEGSSPASNADLQRIEHHIGGYKGPYNVITPIKLSTAAGHEIKISEGNSTELIIEMNLDHYWNNAAAIKISESPLCTTMGALSKKIASNFSGLFSIKEVK
jgi:hypothetical protein